MKASWLYTESNSEAVQQQNDAELTVRTDSLPSGTRRDEELNELLAMLQQLDTSNLRKAKAIVKEVFFTSYGGN